MNKKYIVRLTEEERGVCEGIVKGVPRDFGVVKVLRRWELSSRVAIGRCLGGW